MNPDTSAFLMPYNTSNHCLHSTRCLRHPDPLLTIPEFRCIGLSPAIEGCPTPSVCVEKCPDMTWEWEEGKVIMRIEH